MKTPATATALSLITLMSGSQQISRAADATVGGEKAIALERPKAGSALQLLSAEILPGRGWNVYQIKAWLPGKGEISVLEAPPVTEAAGIMNGGPEDQSGNKSFSVGGAVLVPYANRITGPVSSDGKTVTADIAGHKETLPANWGGKKPGARQYAMHGLILDQKVTPTSVTKTEAKGELNAGDFGGRWPSQTELRFRSTLTQNGFELEVTATNAGKQNLPLGVGWHPYFRIPSGKREQVRLLIPARKRAPANNYDEVLPTGKIESVKGTPFDFEMAGGHALGDIYLDDTFTDLIKQGNRVVAEMIDPESHYGVRIISDTPQVHAFQVYAPPDKSFVVIEPQFNLADPYSPVWHGQPTGMISLKPGESVTYRARIELFQPK